MQFEPSQRRARLPVLASGSNRSPYQLRKKFGVGHTIPVERVFLAEYDVVFGARISGYGAIPATLFPSAGIRVEVALNWLTEAQLEAMDRTEGLGNGYEKVALPSSFVDASPPLEEETVWAYVTEAGALVQEGALLALEAVQATGRRFRSGDTAHALEWVQGLLCSELPMDALVDALEVDLAFRRKLRKALYEIGRRPPSWLA